MDHDHAPAVSHSESECLGGCGSRTRALDRRHDRCGVPQCARQRPPRHQDSSSGQRGNPRPTVNTIRPGSRARTCPTTLRGAAYADGVPASAAPYTDSYGSCASARRQVAAAQSICDGKGRSVRAPAKSGHGFTQHRTDPAQAKRKFQLLASSIQRTCCAA